MEAGLSFRFPHNQREVAVRIFVPHPEQRPRTIANFIYMCTGELPPQDMLAALRLPAADLAFASSAEAQAAGLKPFGDTAVVRVEKQVMMEIGSSTSKSIFGGFLPDEALKNSSSSSNATTTTTRAPVDSGRLMSIAESLPQLRAGTVLCGNIGMPNTHASRYYVLLADVKPGERENYAMYTPLGMITAGMESLVSSASGLPVHPRSLEPLKPVTLAGCHIEFAYQHLLTLQPAPAHGDGGRQQQQRRERVAVARTAGRVRRRDEDEDEEEGGGAEEASPANAGGEGGGFFHFEAKYPVGSKRGVVVSSSLTGAGPGPAAKRRRGEVIAYDEYGMPLLQNTAVPLSDDNNNSNEDTETAGGEKPKFQYFDAQEVAFLNDIDAIKEKQRTRTHNKMRKLAKRSATGGYGSQSARSIREKALKSKESRTSRLGKGKKGGGGTSSSVTTSRVGGVTVKKISRKY